MYVHDDKPVSMLSLKSTPDKARVGYPYLNRQPSLFLSLYGYHIQVEHDVRFHALT